MFLQAHFWGCNLTAFLELKSGEEKGQSSYASLQIARSKSCSRY